MICPFVYPDSDVHSFIGGGLTYNIYNGLYLVPTNFPKKALNKLSFELAFGAKIGNKYNFGVRIDPIKVESSLDLGFSF